MRPEELAAYAREKYNMALQEKWNSDPGLFYTLNDPDTGVMLAYLMREWDPATGEELDRCDLRCGEGALAEFPRLYLSPPFRMYGKKWVGITLDERTEPDVVYTLFDRAVANNGQYGCTLVLDPVPSVLNAAGNDPAGGETAGAGLSVPAGQYTDTLLPRRAGVPTAAKDPAPERIREMRRLYEYGSESPEMRAQNFCRQGRFMEDYEDDAPWDGGLFFCYYPTYHDMNTRQLRGYFAWRTRVRKGEYTDISASAAYMYVYELLNGIGAASPEESIEKIKAFEAGYLDAGFGNENMRRYIDRWLYEFAVVNGLDPELTVSFADPEQPKRDAALAVMRRPDEHTDTEVFDALCVFAGRKLSASPVIAADKERGTHLFSEIWRYAAAHCRIEDKELLSETDLFTACFGERRKAVWYPLSSAVYLDRNRNENTDYVLNECRIYRRRGGIWRAEAYEKVNFKLSRLRGFVHAADVKLRQYLKAGHPGTARPEEAWAEPFIDAVLGADKRAMREAARQNIRIDPAGLEKIRADADVTLDRLLTEEEKRELTAPETVQAVLETDVAGKLTQVSAGRAVVPAGLALDETQFRILRLLLDGADVSDYIKAQRLMPSMVADAVNEALADEIGDNVIICDDDRLSLVEDYREDIERLMGG